MNHKPCKLCRQRGKTWNGDDPKCAFVGEFADNWNCATLNAIRDIPNGVDYQYCDDRKYATIKTDGIDGLGLALWVAWYKSRGNTEAMWLLFADEPPRIPTERELLAIIYHYAALRAK